MTTDALPIPPSDDPTPEGDATLAPSPWEPWQQAGWNPAEVNPYEARQASPFGPQNQADALVGQFADLEQCVVA